MKTQPSARRLYSRYQQKQQSEPTTSLTDQLLMQLIDTVDELREQTVKQTDFDEFRRDIERKLDGLDLRFYPRETLDQRLKPLEAAVDQFKQAQLTSTQKMISQLGGILGIIATAIVLLQFVAAK